jgi:hypothetical protein
MSWPATVVVRWDGTEQRPATVAAMIESVPGAVPAGTAGGAMKISPSSQPISLLGHYPLAHGWLTICGVMRHAFFIFYWVDALHRRCRRLHLNRLWMDRLHWPCTSGNLLGVLELQKAKAPAQRGSIAGRRHLE